MAAPPVRRAERDRDHGPGHAAPRRPGLARAVLCAVVLAYLAAAYQPFRWEAPWVRNTLAVTDAGALRFDGTAMARSDGPPPWVRSAIERGQLVVRLEARTDDSDQQGPARLLTVSGDYTRADLTIAQEGDDLVVRLRRPGTDDVGAPPLRVDGVFADARWRSVLVRVGDGRVVVEVDGEPVATDVVGPDPLRSWNGGFGLTLGNEPDGTRGWSGQLRRATAEAGATMSDHLASYERPSGWLREPLTPVLVERSDVVANLAGFLPFGALIPLLRPGRRPVLRAGGAAFLMSAAMEAGQLAWTTRDPSFLDLALNTVGGVLGAAVTVVVVARLRRRRTGGSVR